MKTHKFKSSHTTQITDTGKNYYSYYRENKQVWLATTNTQNQDSHFEYYYQEQKIIFCHFSSFPKYGKKRIFAFWVKDDKFYAKKDYELNEEVYSTLLKLGYYLLKSGTEFCKSD